MFKIGDIIDYGFYTNIKITDIDDKHYILQDSKGNIKKVYIELVDKHGKVVK